MKHALLFGIAAAVVLAPPAAARGTGADAARAYEAAYAAIPAWARKYNMNCSGCHYPAPPRLNATGQRFKWAGYRMPDEIDQPVSVERVQNYLAVGGEVDYTYEKTNGTPTSENALSAPAVTVYYAGPFGRNFAGFLHSEFGPGGEIERVAQLSGIVGDSTGFVGLRAGSMHNIVESGVAGFDRLPGPTLPLALDGTVTTSIPFSLSGPRLGAEAFYVRGSNRLAGQVLNGVGPDGAGDVDEGNVKKDVAVTDQYLIDGAGSGIEAIGYYGTFVDTLGNTSHLWRLGASANKIFHNFEILGAFVWARDFDLGGTGAWQKGYSYWVSGQYFLPNSELTLYGRYEFLDPNSSAASDGVSRFVVGTVIPLTLPQYLRFALEYHLDAPQGGLAKTNNVTAALSLTY